MPGLHDVAKMTVTGTPGTGTITLNAASTGYQTFTAAGAVDQEVISYRIDDGSNWELGTGTYTASGTTLTRGVVFSSNSNALINASSAAVISIVALAPDYSKVRLFRTVTAGSQSSVTFSNIPAVYDHLQIYLMARGDTAATAIDFRMQFNADTGNNYNSERSVANGGATSAGETLSAASFYLGDIPAASATANYAGLLTIFILGYAQTTFFKSISTLNSSPRIASSTNIAVEMQSGNWVNTAAITSIKIFPSAGNFVNGSTISLYGHY